MTHLCLFSGSEEGRDHPGRRRGVHHDREEDPRPRRQPSLPHQSSLLLSGSFPLIDMNETFPCLGYFP